jgi:hypothetical protein
MSKKIASSQIESGFRLAALVLLFIATAGLFFDLSVAKARDKHGSGDVWADRTLKVLALEEKVGQMLQVRYYIDYKDFESPEYKQIRDQVQKYHIGSVVCGMHFNKSGPIRSSPLDAAKVANQLQQDSKLPLLLAADLERGVATRLNDVTPFPWPMAFGAVADANEVEHFAEAGWPPLPMNLGGPSLRG